MDEAVAPVVAHLDRQDPGGVLGVYLFGSAVTSGLRPDSDVDVLMVTRRSLATDERAALVALLCEVSGWQGHADRFPEAAHRRPIEFTSLVIDDVRAWTASPRRDFQYGEWLRDGLTNGHPALPADDPDVIILAATAHAGHRALRGPALGDLLAPVPAELLRRAVLAIVPSTLEGIEGDERNALLTLARVLVTLETGRIVSKDVAAARIAPTLAGVERALLECAREGYLGSAADDWSGQQRQASSLAHRLADRARQHDPDGQVRTTR